MSSARCARYLRTLLFFLSIVPFVVITATMPPGRTFVNSYFVERPEMMLGRMEYDTGRYGSDAGYTVCVNDREDFDLYGALQQAISHFLPVHP